MKIVHLFENSLGKEYPICIQDYWQIIPESTFYYLRILLPSMLSSSTVVIWRYKLKKHEIPRNNRNGHHDTM